MISHEIRTPLNGVLAFTGFLKDEIKAPELNEYLNYLEQSAQRLEKFSYQALLITELRTGSRRIRLETLAVNDLVAKSRNHLYEIIRAKEINLIHNKNQFPALIIGDAELLQICFDQLIDNSVKFSAAGSDVFINVYSEALTTVIEFADSGIGFPQEILNKPFRFFDLGERHIDKNTGLNLALVKLIMDAHSGQIGIFNNEKKGATVRLIFKSNP